MIDRIDELRSEGESAVAAATDSTALEDVRVHFLGRKAELPNLLRGVAQLPPEERGVVGRAANEARKALEAAIAAREGAPLAAPAGGTLVVGAEREGLPGEVVAACDEVRHIAIESESLNAAMAATVALYEWNRVRA